MTREEAAALGLEQDTPRLVVMFEFGEGGENFRWGTTGYIPPLTLLGAIDRVKRELADEPGTPFPEKALVIAWDKERGVRWFVHPAVPVDAMVGMLGIIYLTIASTHMARQASQTAAILGPDGMPVRR